MPKKDEKPSLGTYLGIVLSSGSDSEIVMAARQAQKLLKAEGLKWHVVPAALEQHDKLLEAARRLKDERDQALAAYERLKQQSPQINGAGNSFASALWQSAALPLSVDNRHAQWLLDLQAQGRIHLTPKEENFVNSCARRRRLSDAQRSWLEDLVRDAVARTGLSPP